MKKLTIIFLIFIIAFYFGNISAQDSPSDIWLNAETDDFFQIKQQAEVYFADRNKGRGSGYKQWKRWEYLNKSRLTENGKITNHALWNWNAYQAYLENIDIPQKPDPTDVTNGSWYFLAPTSYSLGAGWNGGIGRINYIAFHPIDPNTIFIGAPSGGLWKTSNHGGSWTNLAEGIPSIGVSGICIHPANPDIIYILTGDGDAANTTSIGVLKSYNGGQTWHTTGLTWDVQNLVRGYKLRMHPTNSEILFAATNAGIYKTTNGGYSWTQVSTGHFFDIEFNPGNPSIMYASLASSFFRSTDTGENWTQITNGIPTNAERIEIGVTPAEPSYVYLLCGPATGYGSFVGVYRSNDNGLYFSLRANSPNILGYEILGTDEKDQAGYDLAIAVSRTNESLLMTGGINTWISGDDGVTWFITSWWKETDNSIGYTHADIHALEINPLNDVLYCGSDGGIFYSVDFGNNWIDITSGLSATQFYRIAGYEADPDLLIGGTQDNGTNKWTGGSSFLHILGADGMDCIINPGNPDAMYYTSQNGKLHYSWDGGNNYLDITPDGVEGSWITPILMDPSFPLIIYGGYDDVVKSGDGGANWTNMGVDGRGAMAMGTSNPNRIYASFENTIWRSDDGGANWDDKSIGLPGYHITFIAVDPDNSLNIFVTLEGFHNGEKVYNSSTGGTSWTNITGSLPNIIVNCVAFEDRNGNPNDAIYIGTDVGVFYRNSSLGDWIPFSNWLPTVPVFDLEINESNNIITAGTFGRGLWRSPTYTTCESHFTLSGNGANGYSYYQASEYIHSTRVYNQGTGQEGHYKAGSQVKLYQGFHVSGGSKFKAWIGPCGAGIPENSAETNSEAQEKMRVE
jgi:photosystem II stability/assembly factor-like uncharacterized protein